MERQDKLIEMYNYALSKGFCTNKKSFAEYVGINPSNISKIFHDTQGRYLTNSTLLKINGALGNTFSQDWLLTGQEPMFRSESNTIVSPQQPPKTDAERLIEELKAENKALKEQVSDLTKSILNLTNR